MKEERRTETGDQGKRFTDRDVRIRRIRVSRDPTKVRHTPPKFIGSVLDRYYIKEEDVEEKKKNNRTNLSSKTCKWDVMQIDLIRGQRRI